MHTEIHLTRGPIAENISPPMSTGTQGAWLEFRGVVRGEENGQAISALEYEAYPEMASREIRRLLEEISSRHPCLTAKVIHRVGVIPVGHTAIYVGVAASHRGEAIALLAEFMDRLKQDVPIWKHRAIVAAVYDRRTQREVAEAGAHRAPLQSAETLVKSPAPGAPSLSSPGGERVAVRPGEGKSEARVSLLSLDQALAEIQAHCQPLPAGRVPLAGALGRVLRETVCASEDFPDRDRSTRDGYAILQNDDSETFRVVDTLHAADWKPRELRAGEAVRVATGATLPCEHLRVVMQENIERTGDDIRIARHEPALNLRRRGEDVKAGQPLVQTGARLDAGNLALLASAGCARPLVSPRLRVVHFTTGDEIIPPE